MLTIESASPMQSDIKLEMWLNKFDPNLVPRAFCFRGWKSPGYEVGSIRGRFEVGIMEINGGLFGRAGGG
jgi:hypothetical protein